MDERPLEEPLNTEERYLYAIAVRLDAIVHMLSSFMQEYAKHNETATTSNKIEEVKPKKTRKK